MLKSEILVQIYLGRPDVFDEQLGNALRRILRCVRAEIFTKSEAKSRVQDRLSPVNVLHFVYANYRVALQLLLTYALITELFAVKGVQTDPHSFDQAVTADYSASIQSNHSRIHKTARFFPPFFIVATYTALAKSRAAI